MDNSFQGIGYCGSDYVGSTYCAVGTVVQTPPPRRPCRIKITKSQSSGRTLGGSLYVYDRSVITRTYTLIIPKITQSVLDQLFNLFDNETTGNQGLFLWTDHLSVTRTVKLSGPINVVPYSAQYFMVTVTLAEQFTDESIFHDWPYMSADYAGTGYVTV